MAENLSITIPAWLAEEIDSIRPRNMNKSEFVAGLINAGIYAKNLNDEAGAKKWAAQLDKVTDFMKKIEGNSKVMKLLKVDNATARI